MPSRTEIFWPRCNPHWVEDAMSKDAMGKDTMAKDSMKNDKMNK